MVDVCLLGCGGMMPLPGRWLTSLLYRHDGRLLLIDCGEGTQIPLKLAGFGFKAIDGICFTHFHADHIAGLPGLLLTIGNSGRSEPLTIVGPPGLRAVVGGLLCIAPDLPFALRLIELSDEVEDEIQIGSVRICTTPVEHRIPCLAYSLQISRAGRFDVAKAHALHIPVTCWGRLQSGETVEHDGRLIAPDMVLGPARRGIKVSYCTDLRPGDRVCSLIEDSDLLICEGMYGDEAMQQKTALKKHMIFSEAATLARRGKCGELWLTHYSPAMSEPEAFLENAKAIFENTHCGHDLMQKTLNFID